MKLINFICYCTRRTRVCPDALSSPSGPGLCCPFLDSRLSLWPENLMRPPDSHQFGGCAGVMSPRASSVSCDAGQRTSESCEKRGKKKRARDFGLLSLMWTWWHTDPRATSAVCGEVKDPGSGVSSPDTDTCRWSGSVRKLLFRQTHRENQEQICSVTARTEKVDLDFTLFINLFFLVNGCASTPRWGVWRKMFVWCDKQLETENICLTCDTDGGKSCSCCKEKRYLNATFTTIYKTIDIH